MYNKTTALVENCKVTDDLSIAFNERRDLVGYFAQFPWPRLQDGGIRSSLGTALQLGEPLATMATSYEIAPRAHLSASYCALLCPSYLSLPTYASTKPPPPAPQLRAVIAVYVAPKYLQYTPTVYRDVTQRGKYRNLVQICTIESARMLYIRIFILVARRDKFKRKRWRLKNSCEFSFT